MKKYLIFLVALVGTHWSILSQELSPIIGHQQLDSVYIDTKVSLDRKNSGKTVTVIHKAQLDLHRGSTLAQVLNEVSGFEINGSHSNNGQNLGYFVRGGKNRQVLVLIDGVPLNDASQISNDYDLRLVPLDQIEKVEILKGASSVLYGSGAATAVISITTLKNPKGPSKINITSSIGTDRSAEDSKYAVQSIVNGANISGSSGKFFYSGEVNHQFSDGLSAIAAPEGEKRFDADLFNAFHTRANVGIRFNDHISMSQFVSLDLLRNGFDDFNYTDAPNESRTRQIRTGGHFEWKYKKGIYIFNDNYSILERDIESSYPAKYDSKSYSFDTYVQHRFGDRIKAIIGLNGNLSKMNSFTIPFGTSDFSEEVTEENAHFNYFDPYVNLLFTSKSGFNLNTGIRMNIHSVYDNHWVYQINPSYYFDLKDYGLKVLGSYSTAYITPSLYQIFDPVYGNTELMPEENHTIEGGVEFSKGINTRLSLVYFHRKEEQFVDFVLMDPELFLYQYKNVQDAFDVSGLEVELMVPFSPQVLFNVNYTFTNRDDRFALRIPEHKVNGRVSYMPDDKTNIGLHFQYVSERKDSFFNPDTFMSETVSLDDYQLIDLTVSRQLNRSINLFASVNNVFNTEFEELYRYQAKGRNVRFGMRLSL